MCSGRKIGAEEALAWGLVSEVVGADEVLAIAQGACRRARSSPDEGDRDDQAPVRTGRVLALDEQLELEAQLQLAATRTEDFAEGVDAFLEKREPRFRGR